MPFVSISAARFSAWQSSFKLMKALTWSSLPLMWSKVSFVRFSCTDFLIYQVIVQLTQACLVKSIIRRPHFRQELLEP